MSVGDIYRVTSQFSSNTGDIFQWVHHVQQDGGADQSGQVIALAFVAHVEQAFANIAPNVHTSISGDELTISKWNAGTLEFDAIATEVITNATGTGGGSGPANYQDAPVAKFFTSVGRSLGKKYLFGLIKEAFSGQALTSGFLAQALLFALDFALVTAVNGATYPPGNFNTTTSSFRPWSGTVAVNLLTGTQDRRRRGIGL